ncbi:MAG: family 1 encapsulin nanocompartment shell protein [Candidatus Eremiobacterota bacterium]
MWNDHQRLKELPLSEEQAARLLNAAVQEVRRTVVARRFIALLGPLGAGVESVPMVTIGKDEKAQISLEGHPDPSPIGGQDDRTYVRVPLVYKDFIIHWRDVTWSRDTGTPLDPANAVRAAHQLGHAEDKLLFEGSPELGVHGLLTWPGTLGLESSDWNAPGAPVRDVYSAIRLLLDADHHFPYALVTSVDMYEALLKKVTESPVLELEQVSKLCEDGVFWSPQIAPGTAAVVSTGAQNFDIAVAEDLQLAYLGPADMNYRFRAYESLLLRVKRPTAVCVISARAPRARSG